MRFRGSGTGSRCWGASRGAAPCTPSRVRPAGRRGGERRARHVYTEPGATDDVLAAWREVLGGRAWVASREEAVADGWFGPTDPLFLERNGGGGAAPADAWALVANQAEPLESALIGMHG